MQTYFEECSVLENASMMVTAFGGELSRVGLYAEAEGLRGLEVTDPQSAQLALLTIQSMRIVPELLEVRRITVEALKVAVKGHPFAYASGF